MQIGINLTPLQGDHKYRGIGSVITGFFNHLSEADKAQHTFVFFMYPYNQEEALNLLQLTDTHYRVETIDTMAPTVQLPGKLNLIPKGIRKVQGILHFRSGSPHFNRVSIDTLDRYIEFDPSNKLPRHYGKVKIALFVHDIIPYIMESDYLWTYGTARRYGKGIKSALKHSLKRLEYSLKLRLSLKHADIVIANSHHTRHDFVKYFKVDSKKIHTAPLGVEQLPARELTNTSGPDFYSYQYTQWGSVLRAFKPSSKPFLLFVGGTDHRRKMIHLIAAYNNLRARGHDIDLVMSGDAMKGIEDIKNPAMQKYLLDNTSYLDGIHLVGYASNEQRDWLYRHALAFVFPSVYEGFGLPVLEAMQYGTPVITYKNSSIKEVAESSAIYTYGTIGITTEVAKLLADTTDVRSKLSSAGHKQTAKYTWKQTTDAILAAIS